MGYYKRFMENYGKIAKPLADLLKKDAFEWSNGAKEVLERLKKALITAGVLCFPNFDDAFVIETYASGVKIGVVLIQKGHPLAFISEAMAIKHQLLFAIKKWDINLTDRHFIIHTNH